MTTTILSRLEYVFADRVLQADIIFGMQFAFNIFITGLTLVSF